MAQYKNENGTWYIRCRNPVTGKVTTIRRNAKTREPFKTKKKPKIMRIILFPIRLIFQ